MPIALDFVALAERFECATDLAGFERRIGHENLDIFAESNIPVHLSLDVVIQISARRARCWIPERQFELGNEALDQSRWRQVLFADGEVAREAFGEECCDDVIELLERSFLLRIAV